jgi:hypothetical protein
MEKRYLARKNGYDNFDIEVREEIPYVEILKLARKKNRRPHRYGTPYPPISTLKKRYW